jgi:hypothetical protein
LGPLAHLVRQTGQLNQNPVCADWLDHRFGHAEFVDAFAQDFDGLGQSAFQLHGLIGSHLSLAQAVGDDFR